MPILTVLRLVGAGAILTGLFWLVDQIGDRREKKVRAEYAEAARRTNVDIAAYSTADDAVAAIAEAARVKAVEAARSVASANAATADQAKALTAIRRAR